MIVNNTHLYTVFSLYKAGVLYTLNLHSFLVEKQKSNFQLLIKFAFMAYITNKIHNKHACVKIYFRWLKMDFCGFNSLINSIILFTQLQI